MIQAVTHTLHYLKKGTEMIVIRLGNGGELQTNRLYLARHAGEGLIRSGREPFVSIVFEGIVVEAMRARNLPGGHVGIVTEVRPVRYIHDDLGKVVKAFLEERGEWFSIDDVAVELGQTMEEVSLRCDRLALTSDIAMDDDGFVRMAGEDVLDFMLLQSEASF